MSELRYLPGPANWPRYIAEFDAFQKTLSSMCALQASYACLDGAEIEAAVNGTVATVVRFACNAAIENAINSGRKPKKRQWLAACSAAFDQVSSVRSEEISK